MFGVSFPEFLLLGTVALLVLGPEKLPGMLRTMGQWVAKLRKLTTEVRYQSGIDEVILYFNVGNKPHNLVKEQMQRFMKEIAPQFQGKHIARMKAAA